MLINPVVLVFCLSGLKNSRINLVGESHYDQDTVVLKSKAPLSTYLSVMPFDDIKILLDKRGYVEVITGGYPNLLKWPQSRPPYVVYNWDPQYKMFLSQCRILHQILSMHI